MFIYSVSSNLADFINTLLNQCELLVNNCFGNQLMQNTGNKIDFFSDLSQIFRYFSLPPTQYHEGE